MMPVTNELLILIPTYNECENLPVLINQLRALPVTADILFIDDNSPDGTGNLLDEISRTNKGIFVIHRQRKLGIGSAHKEGIEWAYDKHYRILVTMDCDLTHSPKDIIRLIGASANNDIVVGSRFLEKNSLIEWNYFRTFLTRCGHFLTRNLLDLTYDATGAFRLYRLSTISIENFRLVKSTGYSFLFESLYVLNVNQHEICEIPIELPARTYGHSKMKIQDVLKSLTFLCSLFLSSLFNPSKYMVGAPTGFISNVNLIDHQGWDDYWAKRKPPSRLLYDIIASFYRRYLIRRSLDYYIDKYLPNGSKVLHAGCGSGQVDSNVCRKVDLTALDMSVNALSLYRQENSEVKLIHGDIFDTNFADKQFAGIYNLGVMEHFSESEIQEILTEFRRILDDDGILILFWPPEHGISVIFFKILVVFFEKVIRKGDTKFHPTEITRLKSKDHAGKILDRANMSMVEYSFSMRSCFTYAVVVAKKNNVID